MKFYNSLLSGTLNKRYKRFFIDLKYKNKLITAHCPNSGSMKGLLKKGNKIWFSISDNPKRKLKYTTEIIKVSNNLVGINTHLTNKIILEALKIKKIKKLKKYNKIKSEVKYNKNTRFDFLVSNTKEQCFVEVKNVTLSRKNGVAEFPDAITERGTKHLNELIDAKKRGFKSIILFLIQREDCKKFVIAKDIDKKYYLAFKNARKNGVITICYDCKINSKEVILNKKVKILND